SAAASRSCLRAYSLALLPRRVHLSHSASSSAGCLSAPTPPAGTAAFNASTPNRPGVRYGCFLTRARPPGVRSFLRAGIDPYAHATHSLFVALYRLASRTRANQVQVPRDQIAALSRAYQSRVDARANDAMVPTLSQ